MFRLHGKGLLTHDTCRIGHCALGGLGILDFQIRSYMDELSRVIFRKENLQSDRRWWLAIFYSLYIQSHVRSSILLVVKWQEMPSTSTFDSVTYRKSLKYQHLSIQLFTAISAGYDPLALDRISNEYFAKSVDKSTLGDHYVVAQKVIECSTWKERNIGSSFEYLSDIFGAYFLPDKKDKVSEQPTLEDRNRSHTSLVDDSDDRSSLASQSQNILQPQSSYAAEEDGNISTGEMSGLRALHINKTGGISGRSSPISNSGSKRKRSPLPHIYSSRALQRTDSIESMFTGNRRASYSSTSSIATSSAGSSYSGISPGVLSSRSHFSNIFGTPGNFKPGNSLARSTKRCSYELPSPAEQLSHQSSSALKNLFFCECCPKKPKKFETEDELK